MRTWEFFFSLTKYWDFNANKPTSKCPNKEYIEKGITERTKAYTNKIWGIKSEPFQRLKTIYHWRLKNIFKAKYYS